MSKFFNSVSWWSNVAIRPLGLNVPFDGPMDALGTLYAYNELLADWHDEVNQLSTELMGDKPVSWSEVSHYETLAELQLQDSWPIPNFTSHKVNSGGMWWEIIVMACDRWMAEDHLEVAELLAKKYEGFNHG